MEQLEWDNQVDAKEMNVDDFVVYIVKFLNQSI